jgi:hypothetical protein
MHTTTKRARKKTRNGTQKIDGSFVYSYMSVCKVNGYLDISSVRYG